MIYFTSSNFFFWEVSYDMTLVQPLFDFRNYPNDNQDITIRFVQDNYANNYMKYIPVGIYCSFLKDGSCSFSQHPIWNYDRSQSSCGVYYDNKVTGNGQVTMAYFTVNVSRNGRGIIVRLLVPLTLLMLVGALTFWSDMEARVDTAITLLLSISAVYIVILSNIPLVGYLTLADRYVFIVSTFVL